MHDPPAEYPRSRSSNAPAAADHQSRAASEVHADHDLFLRDLHELLGSLRDTGRVGHVKLLHGR